MSGFEPRFFSSGRQNIISEKNNNNKQITVGDFVYFYSIAFSNIDRIVVNILYSPLR